MNDTESLEMPREVAPEFGAMVRLDASNGERQVVANLVNKVDR